MKNGKAFYQDVPAHVGNYLSLYADEIRPLLLEECESDAFWPRPNGAPLSVSAFQRQVPRIILRDTGVAMSLHKFRTVQGNC